MVIAGTVVFALGLFALIGAEFPEIYEPPPDTRIASSRKRPSPRDPATGLPIQNADPALAARIAEQEARKEAAKPTRADSRAKKSGPAYDLVGNHPLGEGWVVQVIANSADAIDMRLWREDDWDTRHPPAKSDPMTIGHSFKDVRRPLGVLHSLRLDLPSTDAPAAEWREEGEHIVVMAGTSGDDCFMRPWGATRVLYFGLGGSDRATCEVKEQDFNERLQANGRKYSMPRPKAFPHDRMVGGDGKPVEVFVSRSGGPDGSFVGGYGQNPNELDRKGDK